MTAFRFTSLIAPTLAVLIVALLVSACSDPTDTPNRSDALARTASETLETTTNYTVAPRIRGEVEPAVASEEARSTRPLPPIEGIEHARLTYAPEVPPAPRRDHATRVVVEMEMTEVVKELADGVHYTFWTFGDEVPGPMIRVREGDLVEFHLKNHPDNKLPHNIDLHAVTGTGGGAEATLIAPGRQASFEFRALQPGLYVYHCATVPVGLHVANGMYGLILVDPEDGLPEVEREYYVMQSEFYTEGEYMERGLQPFDKAKALQEIPDYVVFNGAVGSLMGENALQAAVGETVRLYMGNGGPNLTSSFHVIGEIFDKVYSEGGILPNQTNVQTTLIPAGGSAMVEFTLDVPGTYTLVDHAIFRAFNKGAVGQLKAVGPENPDIFTGQLSTSEYNPNEQVALYEERE